MTQYASYNYYREEERLYKDAYDLKMRDEDVELILKKIYRHFKIDSTYIPDVKFWGHRQTGSASKGKCLLRISHNPSMGLLIHEIGHLIQHRSFFRDLFKTVKNKGTDHHGTHFQTTLTWLHNWAKTKDYWRSQLKRRASKE